MDTIQADERKKRLSASRMERTILCPASWGRSRWIPERQDDDGEAGQTMHRAIDSGDQTEIDGQQVTTVARASELALEFSQEAKTQHGGLFGPMEVYTEQRLWYQSKGTDGQVFDLFSGQLDRLELYPTRRVAIIADFKTLWGVHTPAPQNPQLAAQAVLVKANYDVDTVYVALIEPNGSPQVTSAVFDLERLAALEAKFVEVVVASEEFDAPARPGLKQCKYCPALSLCQEAKAKMPDLISERLPTDTPHGMAAALEVGEMATIIHKQNKETAKRLITVDGWDIPGWTAKPKSGRASLDSPTIIARLRAMGVPDDVIWEKVGITKKSIESLVNLYAKPSEGTPAEHKKRVLLGAETKGEPSIELRRV